MEFIYPIPERRHPATSASRAAGGRAPTAPAWRIERGVVKGFIDYLFEHEGRVYVCDWKGDWLPSWDAADASPPLRGPLRHPGRALHAGGRAPAGPRSTPRRSSSASAASLYCFLRGMRADDAGAGVYFRRPSWAEVPGGQRAMLEPATGGCWMSRALRCQRHPAPLPLSPLGTARASAWTPAAGARGAR